MLGMLEEAALMLHVSWLERKRLETKQKSRFLPRSPPPSRLPFSYPTISGNKRWGFRLHIPCASKNSSSELSSESLAMLCILHSEILWREGLAGKKKRAYSDKTERSQHDLCWWKSRVFSMKIHCCNIKRHKTPMMLVWCQCTATDPICLLLSEPASKMLH